MRTLVATLGLMFVCDFCSRGLAADDLPKMKFNDVKEVAPGVFFRYSSIHATDMSIPFGGSNNIWIVFKDHVVVIDANFPKEARDVLEAIKKTTEKPVKYVLDTHHHGDHAYGNAVWVAAGAEIIGQKNCQRLMQTKGPEQFKEAGRGPTARKDVAESELKVPTKSFDDKLVLDDGTQRVELLFLGHAHTPGDAFAYLPKHKILCTGDACVNGAFNYMGHSDTASWIRVMEKAAELDVQMICPGHGAVAGKELLSKQKRYFQDLRVEVKKGIDAGKSLEDITKNIDLPWYTEWTGKEVSKNGDNVKHVYQELTGKIDHSQLGLLDDLLRGPSCCKETQGWTKPRRVVIPNISPARLGELKIVAPEIEFVTVRTADEAAKYVADADGILGFCTPEIIRNGQKLRWVQLGGGVDSSLRIQLVARGISVCDSDTPSRNEPVEQWTLWRENVRRFGEGQRLLCAIYAR